MFDSNFEMFIVTDEFASIVVDVHVDVLASRSRL